MDSLGPPHSARLDSDEGQKLHRIDLGQGYFYHLWGGDILRGGGRARAALQ